MVATIGFFDGMHEGHRYVISQVMELAERRGDGSIVITFDRHPAALFCLDRVPKMLLTPEEKMEKIAACGVEDVVMFEFDEELASLTANEFLQILKEDYGVDTLLLGYDNHFGKKEKDKDGNFINPTFDDYVKKGKEEGVRIKQLKEFSSVTDGLTEERTDGQEISQSVSQSKMMKGRRATSSSLIRELLLNGDLEEANSRLGYCYSLKGKVVNGFQIGRKLGFPTANLKAEDGKLVPKNGVYAAKAWIMQNSDDNSECGMTNTGSDCPVFNSSTLQNADFFKAVVNIGNRPTFNGQETTIEVHIMNFEGDIYGENVKIEFCQRLRDEMKFASVEELAEQIDKDVANAIKILTD